MINTIYYFLMIVAVAVLLAAVGGITNDILTNGINDCIDDPKYCATHEELIKEWPQFHQHDDEGNVVIVGEPSKELEEHTH